MWGDARPASEPLLRGRNPSHAAHEDPKDIHRKWRPTHSTHRLPPSPISSSTKRPLHDQSMMPSRIHSSASPVQRSYQFRRFGRSPHRHSTLDVENPLSLFSTDPNPTLRRSQEQYRKANHKPDSYDRETETDKHLGLSSEIYPPCTTLYTRGCSTARLPATTMLNETVL